MKAKIDLDKFVASLIEFSPQQSMKYIKALAEQGLKYKDGKIVEIEQENEDEKIKHEIKVILANTDFSQFALDYTFADMISWLEKQTKQNEEDETIELLAKDML